MVVKLPHVLSDTASDPTGTDRKLCSPAVLFLLGFIHTAKPVRGSPKPETDKPVFCTLISGSKNSQAMPTSGTGFSVKNRTYLVNPIAVNVSGPVTLLPLLSKALLSVCTKAYWATAL